MSDHIQQAIDRLEHEIEAIDQRRGELQRAIDAMRPLAGDGPASHRSTKKRKALKRNERTNERTNERAKRGPTGTRPRSLPDGTTAKTARHQEAILTALRAKSPQSPGELATRLKLTNRATLAYQVKPLLKRGAVVATGTTADRQLRLPGRAKEAP